jgi:hypothetical protein
LSWFRTHDHSVRAGGNGSCFKPRDHRDLPQTHTGLKKKKKKKKTYTHMRAVTEGKEIN